jgi:hypothetical protein
VIIDISEGPAASVFKIEVARARIWFDNMENTERLILIRNVRKGMNSFAWKRT